MSSPEAHLRQEPTLGFRMDATDERTLLPEVPISGIDRLR